MNLTETLKRIPPLYKAATRFPRAVLLVLLVVTLLAFLASKSLKVENDLATLLPQNLESVQGLKSLEMYFGGLGYLVVAIESDGSEAVEQFADAFASEIERLSSVLYVDFRKPIDFFQKRQWLYIDLQDLREMENRLDRSLKLQGLGVSSSFNSFMDFADAEDRPDLTFSDIQEKYKKKLSFGQSTKDPSEKENLLLLKVKAKAHQQSFDSTRRLIADIQGIEERLKSGGEFKKFRVAYTGDHPQALEIIDLLNFEVKWISSLVFSILFVLLFLYFRKVSAVFLIWVPLIVGILWTGGMTALLFKKLNLITGFAGAILAGLGSDYGIHLLSRYFQERKNGASFDEACRFTFAHTGRATRTSMVVTVFAFLALVLSKFEAAVEFGVIGALGIFMNYLAMVLILPALLTVFDKRSAKLSARFDFSNPRLQRVRAWINSCLTLIFSPKFPGRVLFGAFCLLLLFLAYIPGYSKIAFEDGRIDKEKLPGNAIYEKVIKNLGGTLQPTVLIAENTSDEQKILREFNLWLESDPSAKKLIGSIVGVSTFIPENQPEKREILERILAKFQKSSSLARSVKTKMMASLKDSLVAPPIARSSLPIELRRLFESPLVEGVHALYLFPAFNSKVWAETESYVRSVLALKENKNLDIQVVDTVFVATDFVNLIKREAPRLLLFTLVSLFLVFMVSLKPWTRACLIFFHLVASLGLLLGVLWVFKIPINTMNVIVFPIILGAGIDSFIHFSHRYDETGDMHETVKDELPSIFLSNLANIIGFAALLFTSSAGLRSVGLMAVLGLGVMALMCGFILPRALLLSSSGQLKTVDTVDFEIEKEAAEV